MGSLNQVVRVHICLKGTETPSSVFPKLTQCEERQLEGVRTAK